MTKDARWYATRGLAYGAMLLLVGTPTCFFGGAMAYSEGSVIGGAMFYAGAAMMIAGAVGLVVGVAAGVVLLGRRLRR